MLRSIAKQTRRPDRIVAVDNGSTDNSVRVVERFAFSHPDLSIKIVSEPMQGKIRALEKGFHCVETPYTAFCDADTFYPSHYFDLGLDLLSRNSSLAGAMAIGLSTSETSMAGKFARLKGAFVGSLLARQCHTGGFGHIFRTENLRSFGGYRAARWPLMQADHEIVHQILKTGRCVYHRDLWCRPSQRRIDRANVSWDGLEIALYHLTPFALKDWYFYSFLRKRFMARGLNNTNLRTQPWKEKRAD